MFNPQIPHAEAVKVEVIVTRPDGSKMILSCDKFDYVEFDKQMEPQFYPYDSWTRPILPPAIARLSLHIERPRGWTIYDPRIAPAIDDGDVVEEYDGE
jgi:hypothetical protein